MNGWMHSRWQLLRIEERSRGKFTRRKEGAYRITLFRFDLGLTLVDSAACDALSGEAVETEGSRIIPSANGMQKPPKSYLGDVA
jgi:hypothetical protein